MKRLAVPLFLAALASVAPAQEEPLVTVRDVLLRDTFEGTFEAPGGGAVHYETFLGVDAKFDVEIDGRGDVEAPGLALRLFGPDGAELVITGTNKDKSKPNRNLVKWVNVKAPATGLYRLEMTADGAGAWRFRLNGSPKNVKTTVESEAPLPVGDEGAVPFVGLAGGKVTGQIKSPGKDNKLKGQFTRVIAPESRVSSLSRRSTTA